MPEHSCSKCNTVWYHAKPCNMTSHSHLCVRNDRIDPRQIYTKVASVYGTRHPKKFTIWREIIDMIVQKTKYWGWFKIGSLHLELKGECSFHVLEAHIDYLVDKKILDTNGKYGNGRYYRLKDDLRVVT